MDTKLIEQSAVPQIRTVQNFFFSEDRNIYVYLSFYLSTKLHGFMSLEGYKQAQY